MKNKLSIPLIIVMMLIITIISAQTDTVINGVRYKKIEPTTDTNVSPKKHQIPLDSTFILNNKKLKYYNNWFTLGAGGQQNLSYKRNLGFIGGLDFNFHLKQHYFQLGTEITGEKFGFYTNYQFHLGYGKRYEDKDLHFAGFVGPSYSTGFGKVGDSTYTRKYNEPGVYLQVEIVKKITYDVGIGACFFAEWNPEQTLIGLRAILYFSGAYKGKKTGKQYQD